MTKRPDIRPGRQPDAQQEIHVFEWQAPTSRLTRYFTHSRTRYLLWAALGVLAVAAGIGLWLLIEARSGLDQIQGELQTVVEQELWAVERGRPQLAHSLATGRDAAHLPPERADEYALLQDATSSASLTPQLGAEVLDILSLDEQSAVVRVAIRDAGSGRAYRQVRFYRSTEEGWRRADPSPALLGEWRKLETDYFVIDYLALDAGAVAEAAPRLDALAAALRRDFGLAPAGSGSSRAEPIAQNEKVALQLTPFPDRNMWWLVDDTDSDVGIGRGLTLPSPSIFLTPIASSDADALLQTAILPVIGLWHDLAEQQRAEISQSGGRPRARQGMIPWLTFVDAYSLWEFWASDVPLAEWKSDMISWLYHYPQNRVVGDPANLPDRYDEICRAYGDWRAFVIGNSLPLRCTEMDRIGPLAAGFRPRLNDLIARIDLGHRPDGTPSNTGDFSDYEQIVTDCCLDSTRQARVVGLVTVLDYTVSAYGREKLPLLLGALGEHEGWETLIPAVFGLPAAEFEAGWQADLIERYGPLPITNDQ